MEQKIRELIAKMTLEEKAGMCSGEDFWHTKAVERLGIPGIMMSDGPHGLRKQDEEADNLGMNESIRAVCFPAGCALAAGFDRELAKEVGAAIGNECQAENVGIILGPAANIKRSPLCGRNFEYYSEDPYVAGEIAASQIQGTQSKMVGTSMKHFFANSQEKRRMTSSSQVDERTLREIYLPAFETAVKKAKPWTIMCSYNKINGTYAAENRKYLTEVLKEEWGFDGFVVSDWGAVNDRVPDLKAGLEVEMPGMSRDGDRKIIEAVKDGTLDEKVLDEAVARILRIVFRFTENRDKKAVFDREKDHALAEKVEEECIVLLKNEEVLPLKASDKVAFIGQFAKTPRYQGGGSSHINAYRVDAALDRAEGKNVIFAQGYDTNDNSRAEELIKEAVETAKKVQTAVIFAGLPDSYESEGYDRTHMGMPEEQNELIERVAEANPNVVVVLHNGAPVEMPWIGKVKAVVETYLGGQGVGSAAVKVLYGEVNPSGHLAESFPRKLSDNPSYLFYGREEDVVEYREGIYVGYRYYDTKNMDVLFPFGHGLSYTTFQYENLKTEYNRQDKTWKVTVDVTNTGDREGKEVVQLYIAPHTGAVSRPVHELKGFEKITLASGETKRVTFVLCERDFSYYDVEKHRWVALSGVYGIEVGSSSRDIRQQQEIMYDGEADYISHITKDSAIGDVKKHPRYHEIFEEMVNAAMPAAEDGNVDDGTKAMMEAVMREMPLRSLTSFSGGKVTEVELDKAIKKINGGIEK